MDMMIVMVERMSRIVSCSPVLSGRSSVRTMEFVFTRFSIIND